MGLELFKTLNSALVKPKKKMESIFKEESVLPIILKPDFITIPTCDKINGVENHLTAFSIKDYRKRRNNLYLLPKTDCEIDRLLFNREELIGCTTL